MPTTLADVNAAVLVGGRGTRLHSVVSDRPKALAPVLGRPYLSYLLDYLGAAGLRRAILLTGYMADAIECTFGKKQRNLHVAYSREPAELGTGGALRHAWSLFESSSVLILNGDSYWGVDLGAFWKFHTTMGSQVTLGITWVPNASRYGQVHLRGTQLCRFEEKKPQTEPGWINAGVYLASLSRIEEIPPQRPVSLEREMFPRWVKAQCCFGYRSAAPFLDIGTPEAYACAEAFFQDRLAG